MKYRTLDSDLTVSAVGLGCMGMSHAYGAPANKKEMAELLAQAVGMGYTFFDTAEVYGPFTNEQLLGEAFRGIDESRLVIATKFGFKHQDGAGLTPAAGFDSRPEQIKRVAEASLKRLGVECLDLFYQHRVDPNVPIEEVAGAVKWIAGREQPVPVANIAPPAVTVEAPKGVIHYRIDSIER